MPPQQHNRLLDLVDNFLDFGAHRLHPAGDHPLLDAADVSIAHELRNRGTRCNAAAGSVQPTCSRAHSTVGLGRDAERTAIRIGDANDRIVVRRRGARLESLENDPLITRSRPHPGFWINANKLDAGRNTKRHCWLVRKRNLHEIPR